MGRAKVAFIGVVIKMLRLTSIKASAGYRNQSVACLK